MLTAKGTEQASGRRLSNRQLQSQQFPVCPIGNCNPNSFLYIPHLPMFDVLQAGIMS